MGRKRLIYTLKNLTVPICDGDNDDDIIGKAGTGTGNWPRFVEGSFSLNAGRVALQARVAEVRDRRALLYVGGVAG